MRGIEWVRGDLDVFATGQRFAIVKCLEVMNRGYFLA